MDTQNFRLLIHHHHAAHLDGEKNIWLTSVIGRWVSALSTHFKEIGLLVFQTAKRSSRQDTLVPQKNIKLLSLGPPGNYWGWLSRARRIRQVCQQLGPEWGGMVIRGLTPRQYTVWKHTPVPQKAFLLVRSPKQKRIIRFSPISIASATLNRYREYEFKLIAKADTLLMVNSPLYLSEVEMISGKTVHFVPTNTIRIKEFSPFKARSAKTPCRLLYVGRLHFLKGLRELFQAVAILKQQGQICILDLVGSLDEPVHTQLLDLAHQLGIADTIRWHDFVPFGPDLFRFYKKADIFILPSYTEGFPHVLWEAAANCCPIITTSVGGIPALLEHEKHALLIPPKTVEPIVNAVNCLMVDDILRTQLVETAYQHATNFSVEACAQKCAAEISEVWNLP